MNAIAPFDIDTSGAVQVRVERGGNSITTTVAGRPYEPGVFRLGATEQALIVHFMKTDH